MDQGDEPRPLRPRLNNLVGAMSGIAGEKNDEIINRQWCHFFMADPELGQRVVDGLGVDVSKVRDELEHA